MLPAPTTEWPYGGAAYTTDRILASVLDGLQESLRDGSRALVDEGLTTRTAHSVETTATVDWLSRRPGRRQR